ncbi:hypothetical protein N9064_00520 [bacterium]|nr:hypothetical protein [bacterium]
MNQTITLNNYEFDVTYNYTKASRGKTGHPDTWEPDEVESVELEMWEFSDYAAADHPFQVDCVLDGITCCKEAIDIALQEKLEEMMEEGELC